MKPRDQVERDLELLDAALERTDLDERTRAVLQDMRVRVRRFGPLKPKQRAYAEAAHEGRRYEAPIEYENLVSSGKAPRGNEVELMVKDKPLKPPGRKSDE